MIGSDRRATIRAIDQPGIRIRPYPTGRFLIEPVPGNKLPGYDRSVPPGQNQHTRVENKFAQPTQNHANSESLTQRWANVQYSEHAHESPLGDFAKFLLLAKNSPG